MRLDPIWVAVLAITAPVSLSLPATGQTSNLPTKRTEPLSLPPEMAVSREVTSQNVAVENLSLQPEPTASPELRQVQTPTTPTPTQPNQSTPNTPGVSTPGYPETQPPPVAPPPGAEGEPQQETPDQIQIPITPGTPSPDNNLNLPPAPPGAPPAPLPNTQPGTAPALNEPRVLVSEVAVSGEQGQLSQELQNQVYGAIRTQPGRTTTRSQLQEDINRIFATGFFSNVRAVPEDTPLGVRVSFIVQPNPVLRNVQVQANVGTNVPSVLPPRVVNDTFKEQYGSILNLRRLQEGIKGLNQWYQNNGYVLAQVIDTQVAADGTVTLQVAEGVVEDIQVRFVREGEATNDEGEPIEGRTRDFIITRELELQPGEVFNRNTVQRDLQRVYGLGIFEDVQVALNPAQDPRKVVVVVNVDEGNSGSVAAGAGISSASGLFGTISYQEQNLGGNDQNLGAELQVGQRELLFDVRFTDPWIAGDPYRTSYTVNAFRRRSLSLIFDGEDEQIELVGTNDRPRVLRQGGGVTFTRPLSRNPLSKSEWSASAGLQYQRVSIRDDDGDIIAEGVLDDDDDEIDLDELEDLNLSEQAIARLRNEVEDGDEIDVDELEDLDLSEQEISLIRGEQVGEPIDLSFSGDGTDDLLTLQLGLVRDRRNDSLRPTSGSLIRFGVEQSVPVGSGSILLNRLRGSYSQYIPVNFTNFTEGAESLAFNVQAGTVLGDLPPYEAFSLGGSNSVRGYDEGDLGAGRSFVQATAEYRFPIFSAVGGALFVDVGSDLGTGDNVPGEPAELLGKPGSGIGYGLGLRVQSPIGPLRIDYGFNDDGNSRLHFGIGERF